MISIGLQSCLQELCRESDMSPAARDDMEKRFQSLRGSGHLPQGREQRATALTDKQIASAMLGLAIAAPEWAGHAVSVLSRRFPAGGKRTAFRAAPTLIDALALLVSDVDARRSLIAVQIGTAEHGVNSHGYATIAYEEGGQRKRSHYVAAEAVSLLQPGAEAGIDPDQRYAPASREFALSRRFFDRLADRVVRDRAYPPPVPADSTEYDAEEAERARRERLGAKPSSRYLHVGVDNQVTWPREEMPISFAGHALVLMPKTTDHVQSVHVDLHANRLTPAEAITLINRLLSLMTWCDDQFAVMQDGWSGNPVPVAVQRRNLAFTTTHHWVFNRKIPETEDGRRALALYRDGRNAEQNFMLGYAVLSYFKIIEIRHPEGADVRKWLAVHFPAVRDDPHDQHGLETFLKAAGDEKPEDYLWRACRLAVAHVTKRGPSDPDAADELRRLDNVADIMRRLARRMIREELAISDNPMDGS